MDQPVSTDDLLVSTQRRQLSAAVASVTATVLLTWLAHGRRCGYRGSFGAAVGSTRTHVMAQNYNCMFCVDKFQSLHHKRTTTLTG